MPIFSNPKSTALNPDKLANKKVFEKDIARVRSGTPSASSQVNAETFDSLLDTLESVKIELIKINENVSLVENFSIEPYTKLSYGRILNEIAKAKKIIKKVLSPSITTTELNKLQEITDEINAIYIQLNTNYEYMQFLEQEQKQEKQILEQKQKQEEKEQEADEADEAEQEQKQEEKAPLYQNINRKDLIKLISFFKQLIEPLKLLMNLLNTKLTSAGNDVNPKIQAEISGINAPEVALEGAGFCETYHIGQGAPQYQNQKYI